MKDTALTRRGFLRASMALGCGFLLPRPFSAMASETDPWYAAHRDRFTAEFEVMLKSLKAPLTSCLGSDDAGYCLESARSGFEKVLAELPPIGGDQNLYMKYFISGAQYLALYSPLKKKSVEGQVFGKIMYDLVTGYYASMSEEDKDRERDYFFSDEYLEKLDVWAFSTLERWYGDNWLCMFIRGDWRTFDFGYDVRECAVFKLFARADILEVMPYFCCLDFPRSIALGTGLEREKSLGFGDTSCIFRYRKGREVTQNWDTEMARLDLRFPPSTREP
ncbi:MAG: L-2-amino-thiazoline-4-carboxylic acid hydrolase [Candidatus Eremiobacteraeota bacterium]|nr:L-2-amino-thiazoline-4-carboxylic acid hydrolase [Candidatus Eremiobacteraeota bacterium]